MLDTHSINSKQGIEHLPETPYPEKFPWHVPLEGLEKNHIYMGQPLDKRYTATPVNQIIGRPTILGTYQCVFWNNFDNKLVNVTPKILENRKPNGLQFNPVRFKAWHKDLGSE